MGPSKTLVGCDRHGHELTGASPAITPERREYVDQQKRRRHLFKKVTKRGVPQGLAAKTVYLNDGRWVLSRTFALHLAYPNRWFVDQFGQRIRSNDKL